MISVVIVTHNSEACLGECLDAIAGWLPDSERLVIDNASTDSTRAVATQRGATVMALPENIGFGRACNLGASHTERAHILFLNPDVTVRSVDVSELVKELGKLRFGLVVPVSTSCGFTFRERSWTHDALSLTFGSLRPRELTLTISRRRSDQLAWASGAA